ncbi:MAG: transposase [Amphritea sp.]|nr:transposase [Amphritea sp.]
MKGNSSALRKGRYSESGRIYLVTFVTHLRRPIFNDFWLGREVAKVLCNESMNSDTLTFVVMPDHVHWLVQINQRSLSQTVQSAKSLSTRAITRISGCSNSVWQRGFHDHALRKDEDILSVARYVVMNPVRAGIVKSVKEYPLWDAIWL